MQAGNSGQDASRFLDNAMQAAERGATLTQRMLAFARKQDLHLQTVDVAALVRGMAELLQRTIGAGFTIDTQFPLILKSVHADPAQLELALMNLAVNARDSMPEGGRMIIAAAQERVHAQSGLAPGEYVRLSIKDEGEGMDEETLAKAVDPFFTTKGVGKGTGLGLSMVGGMAEQCGGKLVLRSAKGAGTTAEIWLPVATDQPRRPEPVAAPAKSAPSLKPLTVLAVDDDETVLINTTAMLADLGHTVLQAASGQQALRVLNGNKIDLLLTDFAMPGMTGAELAEAAQASWPNMPLLMISGYADLPEGATLGLPRLAKPFRQDQLATAIARLIGDSHASQTLGFRAGTPEARA